MKRELNEQEKTVVLSQLQRLQREINNQEYLIAFHELQLSKGLAFEFNQKVEKHQQLLEVVKQEFGSTQQKIDILKEQLETGVEVKEQEELDYSNVEEES